MSYAVHVFRLVLYGSIALFILYISLQSNFPSSAIRGFESLHSQHETHAGLQQLGAVEKSAHADHSFNYLENIPDFSKLPTYSDLEASFSGLSKRDVCSDVFPGTVRNTCTPGNTLCCVSLTSSFPQCQVVMNSGYCCVSPGPTGGCYIDLTTSACGTTGAVKCKPELTGSITAELAEGTTEACCPAGMICPGNFNQSNSDIRCQIPYPSASSTSTSSSSTSTSSSTTTRSTTSQSTAPVSPTVTSTPSSSTPAPPTSATTSSTLSAGAIAGIAVGAVAVILLAVLIFLLLKKRRNKARDAAVAGPYTATGPYTGTPYANTAGAPYGYDPYKQGEQYPREVGEMDAVEQLRPMGEMDAMASGPHLSRHELDASIPQR